MEDANRKGLDKLTMDEINAEIVLYRREKAGKRIPPRLSQGLFGLPTQTALRSHPCVALSSAEHCQIEV
jgi:hypothetical protein